MYYKITKPLENISMFLIVVYIIRNNFFQEWKEAFQAVIKQGLKSVI